MSEVPHVHAEQPENAIPLHAAPHEPSPHSRNGPFGRLPLTRSRPTPGITILWIDDEIREQDATVMLLSLDGFAVDVARSGADGLSLSRAHDYRAIIVDLRLPDMDGLDVVRRLRTARATAPIMLMSGYLDVEAAAAAARLGVRDIRPKPVFGDDLTDALRELVRPDTDDHRHSASSKHIARGQDPSNRTNGQQMLVQAAVRLTQPELTPAEFVALSVWFRRFILDRRHDGEEPKRPARNSPHAGTDGQQLRRVLGAVERDLAVGRLQEIDPTAESTGMEVEALRKLLERCLCCTYRECRRALRLRPALRAVAFTDEQYSQIAYRFGYAHPTQFTRDFGETLGLAPHGFRALASGGPLR